MPPHCTIIPPHMLRHIASSSDAPQELRDRCFFTLQHNELLFSHHHESQQSGTETTSTNPVNQRPRFIIPPAIQDAVARHHHEQNGAGSEEHQAALGTIDTDAAMREARATDPNALPSLLAAKKLNRAVYTANGKDALPGRLIRSEGQPDIGSADPSGDPDECYRGFKSSYDFFKNVFNRNSIDGRGMKLIGTVHYTKKYNNAFWNGTQMVYGDGDGVIFNGFTDELDVIGHELTHGVTERTAQLIYEGQSGALNESISDCFGSMIKQYKLGQTSVEADWLIGEGIFTKAVNGKALRSMKAPGTAYDDPKIGKDTQPATMDGYVDSDEDNGGVHTNSGIPNHAFYLIAVALGGNSWDQAGPIWYNALTGRDLPSDADFETFARLTFNTAKDLFGDDVAAKVSKGWSDVGIDIGSGHASE